MDQKGDPGISAPKVLEHDTSDVLQYHLENIFIPRRSWALSKLEKQSNRKYVSLTHDQGIMLWMMPSQTATRLRLDGPSWRGMALSSKDFLAWFANSCHGEQMGM